MKDGAQGHAVSKPAVAAYLISLRRRRDRRAQLSRMLPAALPIACTADWPITFDGWQLSADELGRRGVRIADWQIPSANPWWSRPLRWGEIGCTLAHLACWNHALRHTTASYVLVLEDDAVPPARFLPRLTESISDAERHGCDLLYLGRVPQAPDRPVEHGLVVPGYSHCTYGYLLRHGVLATLLSYRLDQAIIPIDEFLPATYTRHPRPDVRHRYPPRLTALAVTPDLITQRTKTDAGSDTEDSDFFEHVPPQLRAPLVSVD